MSLWIRAVEPRRWASRIGHTQACNKGVKYTQPWNSAGYNCRNKLRLCANVLSITSFEPCRCAPEMSHTLVCQIEATGEYNSLSPGTAQLASAEISCGSARLSCWLRVSSPAGVRLERRTPWFVRQKRQGSLIHSGHLKNFRRRRYVNCYLRDISLVVTNEVTIAIMANNPPYFKAINLIQISIELLKRTFRKIQLQRKWS